MLITVPEAARKAKRNPETVRRWIWAGKLRSRKLGNQHMIEEEDLGRVLAEQAGSSDKPSWEEWYRGLKALNARIDSSKLPSAAEMIREVRDTH